MGVDFKLVSLTDPFGESPDVYLKYAWRDLEWEAVFGLLGIDLAALYNNTLNWWSEAHIVAIRDLLVRLLAADRELLWCQERLEAARDLSTDILVLRELFDGYVTKNARILVI